MELKGLDKFRQHFQNYTSNYILIGGAACHLAMEEIGIDFRVTKDLDIVLIIEELNPQFVKALWQFIREGEYQIQEKATGKKQFYRFSKPHQTDFPFMLELFSRTPEAITLDEGSHLIPIPIDDEVSSLSAILLNDDYYAFIKNGTIVANGLSYLHAVHLIPLKAYAWLNLTLKKKSGELVDSKLIKKHKNDIFRLAQIVSLDNTYIPSTVHEHLNTFLDAIENEKIDLKSLGVMTSYEAIMERLRTIYVVSK